jgi:hypothetical protein
VDRGVAAARLDRAYAERARDQRALFDFRQRHLGRRERSLTRRQPAEHEDDPDAGTDQRRFAVDAQVHGFRRPR